MAKKSRAEIRRGVHSRIRKKVSGTSERPRLAVFRSINHIYAQVIDDVNGKTLASASSLEKSLKVKSGGTVDGAVVIGKAIAERAISAGVNTVVFDRGGYIYHGRVKALLDATREGGLNKDEGSTKKGGKKAKGEVKPEVEAEVAEAKPKKAKAEKSSSKKTDEAPKEETKDLETDENKDE